VISVETSLNGIRFFKIKFDYGVAILRSEAVIHRISSKSTYRDTVDDDPNHRALSCKSMDFDGDPREPALSETSVSFFATESSYLFLRLYCLLVQILSRIQECVETSVAEQHNDFSGFYSSIQLTEIANTALGKKRTFDEILNGIRDYINGDVDSKTLETRCRALSRTSVYLATTLPKLLDTLNQSFSTVCQEGLIIPLFDYCMERSIVSMVFFTAIYIRTIISYILFPFVTLFL